MITYTLLTGLAVIAAILVDLAILRTNLLKTLHFWVFFAVLTVMFLIANGVLTAAPVVLYNDDYNLGLRLGTIPAEDIFYGFALILPTLSIYARLTRQKGSV